MKIRLVVGIVALAFGLCMSFANAQESGSQSQSPQGDGSTMSPREGGGQCIWNPIQQQRSAPQCGFNDLGVPIAGLYDCGKDAQCHDVCKFVRCVEP